MTESRIFKYLNLRKKADRNFRGTFLKNCFRHVNSNPPSWLARSRYHMDTFWKAKYWSSDFWEGQPFLVRGSSVPKKTYIDKNRYFSIILDLGPPRNRNSVYFLWEKVYIRKFCSVIARGFWFKTWYFPLSACCRQLSVSHRYLATFTMA